MRIPTYDSNAKAPAVGNYAVDRNLYVPDVRANTFGEIANGLENYSKVVYQQEQEARKTEYFKADMAIQAEILDAKSKMFDSIQNGGSYKNAEGNYQKQHDAIVAKYADTFKSDPNVYERSMAEYQRLGVGNTVELRNVVQARRKRDAIDATNLMVQRFDDNIMRSMISGDTQGVEASIASISGIYGRATAVGAISPDEAKQKIVSKISNVKSQYAEFESSKDPFYAKKYLDDAYNKKEILSDDYISSSIKIEAAVKKEILKRNSYISLEKNPYATSDDEVDAIFSSEFEKTGGEVGSQEYANAASAVAVKTKKLPPEVAGRIRASLSTDVESLTVDRASEISRYAIMMQSVPEISLSHMSDEDKAALNIIADQVSAGADVLSTVKMALKSRTIDTEKSVKDFTGVVSSGIDNSAYLAEKLDWTWAWRNLWGNEPIQPTKEHVQAFDTFFTKYKNAGLRTSEARAAAYQDFRQEYQPSFTMWGDKAELVRPDKPYLEEKLDSTLLWRAMPGKQGYAPTPDMQRFFDNQSALYYKSNGGTSLSKARELALRDVNEIWAPFQGRMVKYPPVMQGVDESRFYEHGIKEPLQSVGLYDETVKYTIGHDRIVEREVKNGKRQWTYPILYENQYGVMVPVFDPKVGKYVRTNIVSNEPFTPTPGSKVESLLP